MSLLKVQNSVFVLASYKNLTSYCIELNLYSRVIIIHSREYNRQIQGLADLRITINPTGMDFIHQALCPFDQKILKYFIISDQFSQH